CGSEGWRAKTASAGPHGCTGIRPPSPYAHLEVGPQPRRGSTNRALYANIPELVRISLSVLASEWLGDRSVRGVHVTVSLSGNVEEVFDAHCCRPLSRRTELYECGHIR